MDIGTLKMRLKMAEKILMHRLAVDDKGWLIETCEEKEIRLKRCDCEQDNG